MSSAQRRPKNKQTRAFRLEFLEGRELLSLAQPVAINTVHVLRTPPLPGGHVATVTGKAVGFQATSGEYFTVRPGFQSFSAHGASNVGYVNTGGNLVLTPTSVNAVTYKITSGNGVFNLGPRGDWIYVQYVGNATAPLRGPSTFSLQGLVTGGTGRFDGITGTMTATGSVRAGHLSLSFTITPKYPTIV